MLIWAVPGRDALLLRAQQRRTSAAGRRSTAAILFTELATYGRLSTFLIVNTNEALSPGGGEGAASTLEEVLHQLIAASSGVRCFRMLLKQG